MVWLARPPYLRYAAAVLIVLTALWLDLRPEPVVDHPFAADTIAAGSEITELSVEWREVPQGLFPPVAPTGVAATEIPGDTPLLPALMTTAPAIPAGWFALEIPVPDLASAGQPVRLVVDAATWTDGVVIAVGSSSPEFLTRGRTALVAIPGEAAGTVAEAAGRGLVTVLLGG